MARKCVHKGCGKVFEKPDESECVYHPGPPEFHEGQKGWKCCKPRVLTFDEFMEIPPCTKGTHSAVDDTPAPEPKPQESQTNGAKEVPTLAPTALPPPTARIPQPTGQVAAPRPTASPAPPEDESDDPDAVATVNATCKRRGCNATHDGGDRSTETCVHHPGHPIFHEGSKGWTCCKRRVLEFDEFLKIEGCKTKGRHVFVGRKKEEGVEEKIESVRTDFYQTSTNVMASLYLKKVDKASSSISFSSPTTVALDLKTSDHKRYKTDIPLYASIDTDKSSWKVMGTKVELTLVKADGSGWPVLRSDETPTGEIIQTGRAGRA